MNNPYDLHSWSTQYRQERLTEARTAQLEGRPREDRRDRSGQTPISFILASVLSLIRGA
jgi:hypothetical protein